MLLSFAYLAFSGLLRLLVGVGAASSPKTSSYWCCDINSSCSDDKWVAPRCDRQIALSSLRSPECYRGGGGRAWS
jgi:hypothetical protein